MIFITNNIIRDAGFKATLGVSNILDKDKATIFHRNLNLSDKHQDFGYLGVLTPKLVKKFRHFLLDSFCDELQKEIGAKFCFCACFENGYDPHFIRQTYLQ
jgi:hypothetical protein